MMFNMMLGQILDFAGNHTILAWCVLWLIWPLMFFVYMIISFPFRIVSRLFMTIRIMVRGWPPIHIDGNAEFRKQIDEA